MRITLGTPLRLPYEAPHDYRHRGLRRRQCAVETSAFIGGMEAPIAAGQCLLRVTTERIRDTKATLHLYIPHQ